MVPSFEPGRSGFFEPLSRGGGIGSSSTSGGLGQVDRVSKSPLKGDDPPAQPWFDLPARFYASARKAGSSMLRHAGAGVSASR